MFSHVGIVMALLLSLQAVAAPGWAADTAVVKVGLTDMSSAMGIGPAGRGMMGPPEWRMGNYGMMWPGEGMMGWGMMGRGMMAVRINQPSVKAGPVRFDVTNWSRGLVHEMLIVAVDNTRAPLPYDYSQDKVAEDQVKALGDTGDLRPNESRELDLTLSPGSYLLICNVPGHYAAGMAAELTVSAP
jgi:uncharacterized cupredoxin-like copper-binding protein